MDEVDEMILIISRIVGVAIAFLIIIPVFHFILGINIREFFATIAQPVFSAAASR